MTLSMYQASAPVFVRGLENLSAILGKAEAEVEAGKQSEQALMEARLAPDMLALPRQIQIATDTVKGAVSRLAGQEAPAWPDTESTLSELQARIAKALDYARAATPATIDGSEDKTVELKFPNAQFTFRGQDFLLGFALPNFYFHVTTAYAILRHKGVALTKEDFIGAA